MILFNKKRLTEKFQSGGTIPFYQKFDVQIRPESANMDVRGMMQKHQPKSTASPKRDYKPMEVKEVKGLDNDVKAWHTKDLKLEKEIEFMMYNDPEGYMDDPKFRKLVNDRNRLNSFEAQSLAAKETNFRKVETKVQNKGYGDNWIIKNGKGWVRNRNTREIEQIDPWDIHKKDSEGNPKYLRISYNEGLSLRQSEDIVKNLDNSKTTFIKDDSFTNILAGGMSTDDARKQIIDPIFAGASYNSGKDEIKFKNATYKGKEFASFIESKGWKTNEPQLLAAFENAFSTVQHSDAFNTLLGNAVLDGAKTKAQAYERVYKDIANRYAHKHSISTTGLNDQGYEKPEDPNTAGGKSEKQVDMGTVLNAQNLKTAKTKMVIDADGTLVYGDQTKDVDVSTTIEVYRDDYIINTLKGGTTEDQKQEYTLSTAVDKVGQNLRFDQTFISDGTKTKRISLEGDSSSFNLGGDKYNFNDLTSIDMSREISNAYLPIDNNTGAIVNFTDYPEYIQMQSELDRFSKMNENPLTAPTYVANQSKARQAIIDKYSRKLAKYNISIMNVDIVPVIFPKEEIYLDGKKVFDNLWDKHEETSILNGAKTVEESYELNPFYNAITPMTGVVGDDGKTVYEGGKSISSTKVSDYVKSWVFVPTSSSRVSQLTSDEKIDLTVPESSLYYSNVATQPKEVNQTRATAEDIGSIVEY